MIQSDFAKKSIQFWLPFYLVQKISTNSKNIFRKIRTSYAQCVHRIKLQPVTPPVQVHGINVLSSEKFPTVPSWGHFLGEPTLFDESTPSLLQRITTVATTHLTKDATPVAVSFRFPIGLAAGPVFCTLLGVAAIAAPVVLPELVEH